MRTLLVVTLLSLAAAPSLRAQQAELLKTGDTVRLSGGLHPGVFALVGTDDGSLLLADSAGGSLRVPPDLIARLEVRRARTRGQGALRGAGLGVLIGGVAGAVVGLAGSSGQDGWFSPSEMAAAVGVVGGGVGLVIGSVVGLAHPGEYWSRVEAPTTGVSARAATGGRIAISLSRPM